MAINIGLLGFELCTRVFAGLGYGYIWPDGEENAPPTPNVPQQARNVLFACLTPQVPFSGTLSLMVMLTQALMIMSGPEVATLIVRRDVVDHRGRRHLAFLGAHPTQRLLPKVGLTHLAPQRRIIEVRALGMRLVFPLGRCGLPGPRLTWG